MDQQEAIEHGYTPSPINHKYTISKTFNFDHIISIFRKKKQELIPEEDLKPDVASGTLSDKA